MPPLLLPSPLSLNSTTSTLLLLSKLPQLTSCVSLLTMSTLSPSLEITLSVPIRNSAMFLPRSSVGRERKERSNLTYPLPASHSRQSSVRQLQTRHVYKSPSFSLLYSFLCKILSAPSYSGIVYIREYMFYTALVFIIAVHIDFKFRGA